ncbi:MAG: hypothetical protein ABSE96_12760 [Terracidiphilus sp.]|jgi:hypothetical protein
MTWRVVAAPGRYKSLETPISRHHGAYIPAQLRELARGHLNESPACDATKLSHPKVTKRLAKVHAVSPTAEQPVIYP